MTPKEFTEIGTMIRFQCASIVIRSFAADMIDESYPLSTEQTKIVLKDLSDETIGRRYHTWMQKDQPTE